MFDDTFLVQFANTQASMSDVTRILSAIEQGDLTASEQLFPLIYEELRRLAARKLASEKPTATLQVTALAEEVYLRLVDVEKVQEWDSRGHFYAAAAEAMRRILVESAQRGLAAERDGEWERVDLAEGDYLFQATPDRLLALDEALCNLEAEESAAGRLVQLRVFGGLSIDQAADLFEMSHATAHRLWTYACVWLSSATCDEL